MTPDFLCLAKGLTGGYLPLAATLTTDEVYNAFLGPPEAGRTFYHGHTYTGNPLGAAVALANLDLLESPDRSARAAGKNCSGCECTWKRLRNFSVVGDIRQKGTAGRHRAGARPDGRRNAFRRRNAWGRAFAGWRASRACCCGRSAM